MHFCKYLLIVLFLSAVLCGQAQETGSVQVAVSQPLHVTIEYEYAKDGEIVSRKVNGEMQRYEYDLRGQLTGVYDDSGKAVEAYQYLSSGMVWRSSTATAATTSMNPLSVAAIPLRQMVKSCSTTGSAARSPSKAMKATA